MSPPTLLSLLKPPDVVPVTRLVATLFLSVHNGQLVAKPVILGPLPAPAL